MVWLWECGARATQICWCSQFCNWLAALSDPCRNQFNSISIDFVWGELCLDTTEHITVHTRSSEQWGIRHPSHILSLRELTFLVPFIIPAPKDNFPRMKICTEQSVPCSVSHLQNNSMQFYVVSSTPCEKLGRSSWGPHMTSQLRGNMRYFQHVFLAYDFLI